MELIFQEQLIQLSAPVTAEEVVEKINGLIEDGYYFSHFVADDQEVYENHEEFLNLYISTIKRLEIVAKTVKEFTNDILLSAESYIERAKPSLSLLSEEFYNNPTSETWGQFDQLLEGLQWLHSMLTILTEREEKLYNAATYEEISINLQEELENLGEAVENEDFVLIGDIIQYEILPNYEALQEATQSTIDTEGIRPNLN